MQSPADRLAATDPAARDAFLSTLTDDEAAALLRDWRGFLARPDQIAPDGEWDIWLALAGRGWGKTEAGAHWVLERVAAGARSIALIAETQKDLEEVMVPRIMAISPPDAMPVVRYRPVRIAWSNGAVALGYNGTEPNQLRGPQFDTAWVDELAKYRYARDTWDMLQFTMRDGRDPRVLVTTTPRPTELIKAIVAKREGRVVVTRGRTLDNYANLPERFIKKIMDRYEGTRLGRQELDAEILEDMPGALWRRTVIEDQRIPRGDEPVFDRIVIAVDPAVSNEESSDETGIIVAATARDDHGNPHGYVLEDASGRYSPDEWSRQVAALNARYDADCIVAEKNQGGDMVAHVIRSALPNAKLHLVSASRGKVTRAEPASALYEQGRVSHVGRFDALEDQMCSFTSDFDRRAQGYSPDRVDALVWALTELFPRIVRAPKQRRPTRAPKQRFF